MLLAVSTGRRICQLRECPTFLLRQRRTLLCLAIETSCDDTSVAIIETNEAGLPGQHATQEIHESPGKAATLRFHKTTTADTSVHRGIHPIVALESHRTNLNRLVSEALLALPDAHKSLPMCKWMVVHGAVRKRKRKPDLVAVTQGPGMRSNLACGLDTAKGFSIALQVPMIGVHHVQAHALTPRMVWALENSITANEDSTSDSSGGQVPVKQQQPQPEFPFLSLLVSGGHTLLLESEALTKHTILATTTDTAVGEALDKIGRLLLPSEYDLLRAAPDTSFAKHLSNFAFPNETTYNEYRLALTRNYEIHKKPNAFGWSIQTPFAETKELKFSFSGIASRVHALYQRRMKATVDGITREERLAFARTAIATAFEHLAGRTVIALESIRRRAALDSLRADVKIVKHLVLSGGVAANPFLRYVLRATLDARGFNEIDMIVPPPEYCTDNAAMIGWAGIEMYQEGWRSDLGCWPLNKWSMGADDRGKSGIAARYDPIRNSKAEQRWREWGAPEEESSVTSEAESFGTSETEFASTSEAEIAGTSVAETSSTLEAESWKKAAVRRMVNAEIEEEKRVRRKFRRDTSQQTPVES